MHKCFFPSWIVFLLADGKAMDACWKNTVSDEIGELRVGYHIIQFETTADVVGFGHAVSTNPSGTN